MSMLKFILCIGFSLSVHLYALESNSNVFAVERLEKEKNLNGFCTVEEKRTVQLPFGREILGFENLTFGKDQSVFYLRDYVNGRLSGVEVCWTRSMLVYIAGYNNGVINGTVTLFPNGVYTYSFKVVDGVLSGDCKGFFTPFKYMDSRVKFSTTDEYTSVYEKSAIHTGKADFTIKTVGEYQGGRKYNGRFLNIERKGMYLLVSISDYKNGKLIAKSKEDIYKVPPRRITLP